MLVGISEAIRSLLTLFFYCYTTFIFYFKYFIKLVNSFYLNNNKFYLNTNIKYSFFGSMIFTFTNNLNNYIDNVPNNIINNYSNSNSNFNSFNEWLAGLIDGDGCFLLSKKGYASLEITIQLRDIHCLSIIKQKYGGSLKVRANKNHLRYRLHHKSGLLKLIYDINGLIRNPIRLLQLAKICDKYNIFILYPKPLVYNNGWLSGFFDSDGSIYLNLESDQLFITIAQKNKLLLDSLAQLYGGSIYLSKGKENFKWIVFRKEDIFNILNYFNKYPLRSAKLSRIKLVPKYYELRRLKAHIASVNTILGKTWKEFLIKWNNFDC